MTKSFCCRLEVRDYELDSQGIVNNSVYLNYLEHARHLFLRDAGQDFNDWQRSGMNPVVRRMELDYVRSLQGGDRFEVMTHVERSGHLRFLFHQQIRRILSGSPDTSGLQSSPSASGASAEEEILRATITVVFVREGRPVRPPDALLQALQEYMD